MQFEKQLSGHRSSRALVAHRDTTTTFLSPGFSSSNAAATLVGRSSALRPYVHSYQPIDLGRTEGCRAGEGRLIRTRSEQDRSWRIISAAMFGVSARLVGGLAACGEIAFSGFLLAFMSWTIARVLAGCAAYGQSMYPCETEDEPRARMDNPAGAPRESLPLPQWRKPQSVAAAFAVDCVAQSGTPRVDPPGWSASIASLWGELRSRISRQRARRLAIAELRALDDRLLRDVGLCRGDIEHIAGHGDRCE
jgi:uncharacterized protein YjiS (DUF1127 family)